MHEPQETPHAGGFIGIHLGVVNTRVARLNEVGKAEIIINREGNTSTPSVVLIEDDGTVVVGKEAKIFLGTGTPNVFAEFKREMGSNKSWTVGGKLITPIDLSVLLLKKVVANYAEQFGHTQSVVITWPANYRNEQREATKQATARAGLRVVHYIEEATAAAIYFSSDKVLDGKYLVYDFGGGTFDVTLIEAHGNNIDVLYQDGVQELGGKDLDSALLKIIGEKFRTKTGDEFDAVDCNFDKAATESAKHTLSIKDKTQIRLVSGKHGPITIDLSRDEFEAGISHLVSQAEMACESVLRCGKEKTSEHVKKSDIKEIFMAGGTSRVPAMQASVERLFGKKPIVKNPEEAIAMGAAIYAARRQSDILSPEQARGIANVPIVVKVSPHYLGITYNDWLTGESYNRIIFPKGTMIPCRKQFTLTADAHGCLPTIHINQSAIEELNLDFVTTIWEAEFPKGPAYGKHELSLGYHDDGTIFCRVVREADGQAIGLNSSPE